MKRLIVSLFVVLSAALTSVGEEDLFPMRLEVGGTELQRHGVGELRRFGIKGCDVAFFGPAGLRQTDILKRIPRVLELHYVYPIRADQFARAAWKTLRRSQTPETLEAINNDIERLHGWYRDVERGDRYRLTYSPGKGTTLSLNGEPLGRIESERFAAAYFGIWLGEEHPLSTRLRRQLTGSLPEESE